MHAIERSKKPLSNPRSNRKSRARRDGDATGITLAQILIPSYSMKQLGAAPARESQVISAMPERLFPWNLPEIKLGGCLAHAISF